MYDIQKEGDAICSIKMELHPEKVTKKFKKSGKTQKIINDNHKKK